MNTPDYAPVAPINTAIVEEAEKARQSDKLTQAILLTTPQIAILESLFNDQNQEVLVHDADRLVQYAAILRIHVVSHTSLAALHREPQAIYRHVQEAVRVVHNLYKKPFFVEQLQDRRTNQEGHEYQFLTEMDRDRAKLLETAAILFPKEKATELYEKAEHILISTYSLEPETSLVKPLVGLECQLIRGKRHESIDQEALFHDLNALYRNIHETEPHRAATAASWILLLAEELHNETLNTLAHKQLETLIQKSPSLSSVVRKERHKRENRKRREELVHILTPLRISPEELETLYKALMSS